MSTRQGPCDPATVSLSKAQVIAYLEAHPDLFATTPELLSKITPPGRLLGDSVVDFQQFQLKSLQENSRDMEDQIAQLVRYCRGTISVQGQVNELVLRMLRVSSLEQMIEVLAIDVPSVLMLDSARLLIEADGVDLPPETADPMSHSGLTLVPAGTVLLAVGHSPHHLVADITTHPMDVLKNMLPVIFGAAAPLVRSAAFVRLTALLPDRPAMLALGVREAGRFVPGPAAAPLDFLAAVIATQLDRYLDLPAI